MAHSTTIIEQQVDVSIEGASLPGDLVIPQQAHGLVIFAHGSGSSRFSPRNRQVAASLNQQKLATLLIDLLTADEHELDQRTAELRFDIPLLADRLTATVDHISDQSATGGLSIGLFGASTGAGAALIAAADRPAVKAVVSRGGRPDLAGQALARVTAPTLLIVGEHDPQVIDLNEDAAGRLAGPNELAIVPGATHLFEEAGALERVSELAGQWFLRYL